VRISKPFIFFVPAGGIANASARTRVYAYLPFLKEYNFRWHVASYTYHKYDAPARSKNWMKKIWLEFLPLRNLSAFLRADTLYFQKKSSSPWMLCWGKRLKKRIIYDFDDAIYLKAPDASTLSKPHSIEIDEVFKPHFDRMLSQADIVLVSGDELYQKALEQTKSVIILPSVISEIAQKPSIPNATPVIGWVGAPENQRYLRDIEDVLVRLTDEYSNLEVWLITSRPMNPPPRFRHRFIPWSLARENEMISRFTLGIAPLHDDSWCRAKMNLKAVIYMSYGVPAVVSPVGFPINEFEDGHSVLLARTNDDWYHHIKNLLTNASQRDLIAVGGLDVVRRRFYAPVRVSEFAAVLRG
jgi:hypothetical protein